MGDPNLKFIGRSLTRFQCPVSSVQCPSVPVSMSMSMSMFLSMSKLLSISVVKNC
jgi:hypothetical protein